MAIINNLYNKMSGFCKGLAAFTENSYHWSIEQTTKRNVKQNISNSKYTLFIYDLETKTVFAKSEELEGYNKSCWSEKDVNQFIKTLKKV